MTPNEKRLKKAEAKCDKLEKKSDTLRRIYERQEVVLSDQLNKLDDEICTLQHRILFDKQEAKLLVVLQTGKRGVFDKRFSAHMAIKRHPHTYWIDDINRYCARGTTQKVVRFIEKDRNYNSEDAKYYATHGKLKPAPKVAKTTVDIGALNRALSNTGYKVVSE